MHMNKAQFLSQIDKLHTTELGKERIKRNLHLQHEDVVAYCKEKILNEHCNCYKKGKNWYFEIDQIKITIHALSYTIITAHQMK